LEQFSGAKLNRMRKKDQLKTLKKRTTEEKRKLKKTNKKATKTKRKINEEKDKEKLLHVQHVSDVS